MTDLKPAPSGYPIKLVRDRTHQVINGTGRPGDLFYGPLPPEQVAPWLRKKLLEEAAEYLVDPGLDELADVLAVVEGIAHWHGLTLDALARIAAKDKRGGFLTGQMMWGRHEEFDSSEAVCFQCGHPEEDHLPEEHGCTHPECACAQVPET